MHLQLPTLQNWNCANCSGCCRMHQIEITEAERKRIEGQNWEQSKELAGTKVVEPTGRFSKRHRLSHRDDGSCVFLREDGLCEIHAKFGEAAKPLACRVYPYAFHPAGSRVTVSLRYSCPTVVANGGKRVSDQQKALKSLAKDVVPVETEDVAAPRLHKRERLRWPDFLKFTRALDQSLADPAVPIAQRVIGVLSSLAVLRDANVGNLSGDQIGMFVDLIQQSGQVDAGEFLAGDVPRPGKTAWMLFRTHAAQYIRRDMPGKSAGPSYRWRLFRAGIRFARGRGQTPELTQGLPPVSFSSLEQPANQIPTEIGELWTRYLRVKIQGLHFCGAAFYDVPMIEGFCALALMLPTTAWIARWRASAEDRETPNLADFHFALALADHHHGYSPALGFRTARRRVRLLAELDAIRQLIHWYYCE